MWVSADYLEAYVSRGWRVQMRTADRRMAFVVRVAAVVPRFGYVERLRRAA